MTVVDDIRSRLDIVDYIGRHVALKKAGRNYKACCPFHTERTPSFIVSPSTQSFRCYGACGFGGDVFKFAMKYHGWQFVQAIRELAKELNIDVDKKPTQATKHKPQQQQRFSPPPLRTDYAANSDDWQSGAWSFVRRSADALHSSAGKRGLEYLQQRGFDQYLLGAFNLGYNPKDYRARWGDTDVFFPAGVVIPWLRHDEPDQLWRIRYRILPQDTGMYPKLSKYGQATGSMNGLYMTRPVLPNSLVVMTEGEFNALAVYAAFRNETNVIAVATGGTQNAHVLRHVLTLGMARRVLIAFDRDINLAGDTAAIWWFDALGKDKARRHIPDEKDVNDVLIKGGVDAVRSWILKGAR